MKTNPLVTVVIILYNNSNFVPKLFQTIEKQTYHNLEVIFVNNGSSDDSLEQAQKHQSIYKGKINSIIINLDANTGFAFANNVAVNQSHGELILFMNSDIALDPNAIRELVARYQNKSKKQKVAGIAPKMYLSSYLPELVFDSFGICVNNTCSPYNRGIGQIDLGQYDIVEPIMGCCFGCALISKDIFQKLGGLDSSYFAYFEDVDWCIRARKSRYEFFSCPSAIAYHQHSASSSKKSYDWKYYLIFRNYLRTVTKSLGKQTSIRIIGNKLKDLVKEILNSRSDYSIRKAAIKVVINYIFIDSWKYLLKRKEAQQFYDPDYTDAHIFSFSNNEPAHFFDPVNYKQINRLEMYNFVLDRLIGLKKIRPQILANWKKITKSFYCHPSNQLILSKKINNNLD